MERNKRIVLTIGWVFLTFIGIIVVSIIGLFIRTNGGQTVPDTVTTDATIPHIQIDDVTFHTKTFGDPAAPTVVVVHGGPGGNYGYLLNLHKLEADYFVVFYDQRGAGLSPRVPAKELTLQSSVDDLHRIVSHYAHGDPVRIVGHSWAQC